MIRYATSDDVQWIQKLYAENRDLISIIPDKYFLLEEIKQNRFYLYCDEDSGKPYSAMHIEDKKDYFYIHLIATMSYYRGHDYANLLSTYVYSRMYKNARFLVQDGSKFEQWVFANDAVRDNATKLRSLEGMYGEKYSEYEVTYPFPH